MLERTKGFFSRRATGAANYGKKVLNVEEIERNRSWIADMWNSVTGRKPGTVREESFQNAYLRLNLDEDHLARTHRYYNQRFYIFGAFAMVGLGMAVYSVTAWSWIEMGPILGFLAVCFSMMFNASFRLLQIERRELVDFGAWWRAKGSWIPAPFQASATPPKKSTTSSTAIQRLPKKSNSRNVR